MCLAFYKTRKAITLKLLVFSILWKYLKQNITKIDYHLKWEKQDGGQQHLKNMETQTQMNYVIIIPLRDYKLKNNEA